MHRIAALLLLALPLPAIAQSAPPPPGVPVPPDFVTEQSIDQLQATMANGAASSETITLEYLRRIANMDRAGPALRSVISLNPDAIAEARASDARRKAGKPLGPLDGVPILIKDNIETRDPIATTAGSLALKDNVTHRDAPVIARLRAQGAVILGKTNLSEWANIRSTKAMSGWSAVGGLVRNPYALDRTACGSSSGTGAGIAASFAAAGLGTETDGSVVCPSSLNGLVGLKPTLGLVSRTYVVPISHSQDTPGPMARSVKDVAILFDAMAGYDPADPASVNTQYRAAHSYAASLSRASLKGVRIAVYRPDMTPLETARFDAALAVLKAQGAVLVDVQRPKTDGMGDAEFDVLKFELKSDLDKYLGSTPAAVKTRTLNDVIAFDTANAGAEMPYFAQEIFDMAAKSKGVDEPTYAAQRAKSLAAARGAIDTMLKDATATILVQPSYGPAWLSDPIYGDQYGGPSSSELPAISGYPNLTVPMGLVRGLPVGLSFIGPAYSEQTLLDAGYAYEQASHARVAPLYLPTADAGPEADGKR
ncbi:amidase [Sphingomonas sp.]|jgi:amidase|uniref:amidase n=1 Tax=Sphingomonas sp. TaxID=28214 RepID=UPI002E31E4D9|nr:amidase [Sphingomonas sp.]HEX4696022.1 amidase [Sphingomonas sp.]